MAETIARRTERRRRKRVSIWPYIAVLVLAVLVIVGIIAAIRYATTDLTLTLKGESNIMLEFGDSFADAGASAAYGNQDISGNISVSGLINPDKLGSYTLTYTVSHRGRTATAQRTVQIVDTEAPTIVLVYDNNSFTLPGQAYVEEGYVAEDNYDGDITHQVQRIIENDTVIYRVSDSSGNTAEARRPIRYGDQTPPELTLLGEATITITAGTAFTDPGVTAMDNVDGDITDQVTVSGECNIYTPGTYTITYTVSDTYGNLSTASRTIIVEKVTVPPVVEPNGNVIYLTFDDGPSQHTLRLLEILAKYDVKATFFVVGTAGMGYVDEIVAGGHAIALHSNTHDYAKIYVSEEAFFNDLTTLRQKIYDLCGVDTTLMRFPGGSSNTVSRNYSKGIMSRLTKAVEAQGYQYFDWNVDSRDAGGAKTAEEVYQNVINGIQKQKYSIVLQHDIFGYSVDAVESIIQWGLANGYTFAVLDPTSPTAHQGVKN